MKQVAPEAFGPYLIHEVIGIGGMASIHRAEKLIAAGWAGDGDVTGDAGIDGVVVALKRMLPQFVDNDEAVEAFQRETRIARLMVHPNVAHVRDSGTVDDTLFLAMELIPGRTLGQLAARAMEEGTPMPLAVAMNLGIQLCGALDYAHTLKDPKTGELLGIIHRDVSPSNVIVTDAGVAKLIDFGVAKGSAAVGMQTQGATLKGKFAYMAPEYLVGMIDPRADVFAAGVIVWELLVGAPLFVGTDELEMMEKLRSMEIVAPSRRNPAVTPSLDAAVMRALERDPTVRWQAARDMKLALAGCAFELNLPLGDEVVVDWVTQMFGETLTLDMNAPTRQAPLESVIDAAIDAVQEIELAAAMISPGPAPFAVRLKERNAKLAERAATTLGNVEEPQPRVGRAITDDGDKWGNDTAINKLIKSGGTLDDVGAKPVEVEDRRPAGTGSGLSLLAGLTPGRAETESLEGLEAGPVVPAKPQLRPSAKKPSLPPPVVMVAAPRRGKAIFIAAVVAVVLAAVAVVVQLVR